MPWVAGQLVGSGISTWKGTLAIRPNINCGTKPEDKSVGALNKNRFVDPCVRQELR